MLMKNIRLKWDIPRFSRDMTNSFHHLMNSNSYCWSCVGHVSLSHFLHLQGMQMNHKKTEIYQISIQIFFFRRLSCAFENHNGKGNEKKREKQETGKFTINEKTETKRQRKKDKKEEKKLREIQNVSEVGRPLLIEQCWSTSWSGMRNLLKPARFVRDILSTEKMIIVEMELNYKRKTLAISIQSIAPLLKAARTSTTRSSRSTKN